ncbi:hypothetical protein NNJEOMEG_03150 [Fundidesulfovibrio magnetotacticus]|uniref:Molybdopterin synthase catalytic subunit n=1 Tax=Fundidesulfovibrio magnetotacticus TaxID=2730080 RepID=A0A6V8LXI2_9BACT|nr:molybdenum cofactor biosynthesis protein MoaE [Fundidesulfovibrio magnetotacticus]GFK95291.1 hypothetical protein NNJEOMEG_03150 [Fundidesulfovibrio magnetotacticus]
MDISKAIAELKKRPGFTENVGMVLVHNGVVRATRRADSAPVTRLEVHPDQRKIDAICAELSTRPGIFAVEAKALSGTFQPGDDLLYIIVAGDFRENVHPMLLEALNRIKAEAVSKSEHVRVD